MVEEWSKTCQIHELTDVVLQEILQRAENDPRLQVSSWTSPERFGRGNHYASYIYSLQVDFRNGNVTRHLILKLLPEATAIGDVMAQSTAFPTEIKMYSDTLPRMEELLNRSSLDQRQTFGPKFYYGKCNEIPYVLFLEDLSPKQYVVADRRIGLDLDHCLVVMRTLGRFHATSACIERSHVVQYSSNFYTEESSRDAMEDIVRRALGNLAKVVENWPENGPVYASKIRSRADKLLEEVRESMKPKLDSFNVINHGDLWINNMLFKYDTDSGSVSRVKLIDFQHCYYGSPAIDLHHFLGTSVRDYVRAEHTNTLLREYHSSLRDALESGGFLGEIISFDELLEEYKSKQIYGLFTLLVFLPAVLHDPNAPYDTETKRKVKGVSVNELNRNTGMEYTKVLRRQLPIYLDEDVL